jgi:hypothetical protein
MSTKSPFSPVGPLDDFDHIFDVVFLVGRQDHGKDRGPIVRRHQRFAAAIEVAGDLLHGAASAQSLDQAAHTAADSRVRYSRRARAHDHDLVHLVPPR